MSAGFSCKLSATLLLLMILSDFGGGQDYPHPYSCMDMGSYTINSTYHDNLNAALSALSSNASQYGFYSASVGQGQDTAHAVALCRADIPIDQCRSCVQNAATKLLQSCHNLKEAITWYEFCMLHYSPQPINGSETSGPEFRLTENGNATDTALFRQDRTVLLDVLRAQAANGSSLLKAAAGSKNTQDSETLYALLQCIPTLSTEECCDCLTQASKGLSRVSKGGGGLTSNCNLRYAVKIFYNDTRLRQFHVLVPRLPDSPPGTSNENTGGKKDDNATKTVIIIVVPIALCLTLAACAAIFLRKKIKKMVKRIQGSTEEITQVGSLQYDFGRISKATNGFALANKLGQGGFGSVYRGKLSDGHEIAVKRLSRDAGQGDKEFKNEVLLVARLQHRNLITLLGFSMERRERLLIYEFAPNASLDKFIFDPIKSSQLDWQRRFKIILGIAMGLLYLHEDSRLRIIHRDLKPSNILLDEEMNPKIADFGMARLFENDETQAKTTRIVGTYGYMPPEYALYGKFSVKSDIFSFGVLVLEILSGQKTGILNGQNMDGLLNIIWKNWREGTAENMIDPVLKPERDSINDMLRCIHIGLLCVQKHAADRPSMNSVVLMLNRPTVTLPAASDPAFHVRSSLSVSASTGEYDSELSLKEDSSHNVMTTTEFHPR